MLKEKFYKYTLVSVFIIGIVIRLYLYLKNQSLWGDEASLAANILNNSYYDLFKGLNHLQAAPACFTIIVKALIDLFHPQSYYVRDLILRFIPFVSGVLALPFFYYLVKLIFADNKKMILTAFTLLALNPCAIIYSAQLKQYSTEMLCSVLLLLIFYQMAVYNKFKWQYSLIIASIPWFSYSSFFIIGSGFAALLLKNWKKCILFFLPFIASCLIYYFVSLKSVFAVNYTGMDEYWSCAYAFMDFAHPLRFLFRIGELFAMSKFPALISGLVVVWAYFNYLIFYKDKVKKTLIILPFFLVIFASMLHKYPLCARLILFLVPFFVILITDIKNDIAKIIIGIITIFSVFNFTPDAQEVCYSYARETMQYLRENLKSDEIVIIDARFADYDVYFDKLDNKIIRLPVVCIKKDIETCRALIDKLSAGKYYFLSSSYYVKEVTENNGVKTCELEMGFKPEKTKVVYFVKGRVNDN